MDFWKNLRNQKDFFDYLFIELHFKSLDDWSEALDHHDGELRQLGAYKTRLFDSKALLLKQLEKGIVIGASPLADICSIVYPDHKWKFWKFGHFPGRWKDAKSHRSFFDSLFQDRHYTSWQDWYQVKQIIITVI